MPTETQIYTSWNDTPLAMKLTIAKDIRPPYKPDKLIAMVRNTITEQSLKQPEAAELNAAMLDWLEEVISHLSPSDDTSTAERHSLPPETYTYIHAFESLVDELERRKAIDQARHDEFITLIDHISDHNLIPRTHNE